MARRMTAVFILLARRIAKDGRAPDVTAGVAQDDEQFGSQRSDRSIACTRLARSSTYDLDSRGGHKGADGYRRAAVRNGKAAAALESGCGRPQPFEKSPILNRADFTCGVTLFR